MSIHSDLVPSYNFHTSDHGTYAISHNIHPSVVNQPRPTNSFVVEHLIRKALSNVKNGPQLCDHHFGNNVYTAMPDDDKYPTFTRAHDVTRGGYAKSTDPSEG